jgi:hypothetical protein
VEVTPCKTSYVFLIVEDLHTKTYCYFPVITVQCVFVRSPATVVRTDALLSKYKRGVNFSMSLNTAASSHRKSAFAGNLVCFPPEVKLSFFN